MEKQILFKIICERFEDTWINGVELWANSLLIDLARHYCLEEKAKTVGVEVSITCDSDK
jgi:hypothetical protein